MVISGVEQETEGEDVLQQRQKDENEKEKRCENRITSIKLLTPGLDNTRLFISLTAGAGTRCMSLLSSSPSLLSTAASFLLMVLLLFSGSSGMTFIISLFCS